MFLSTPRTEMQLAGKRTQQSRSCCGREANVLRSMTALDELTSPITIANQVWRHEFLISLHGNMRRLSQVHQSRHKARVAAAVRPWPMTLEALVARFVP
jgi:hypothetical protein